MCRKICWVTSEAVLIFISAILGTFAWNHGSAIFNVGNPSQWWGALWADITQHWLAWSFEGGFFLILVVVIWYRSRHDNPF